MIEFFFNRRLSLTGLTCLLYCTKFSTPLFLLEYLSSTTNKYFLFLFIFVIFVVHSLPQLCKLLYCTMQYFSTYSSRIYTLCWMSVTMLYFCTEISFPTLYVKSVGYVQSIELLNKLLFSCQYCSCYVLRCNQYYTCLW